MLHTKRKQKIQKTNFDICPITLLGWTGAIFTLPPNSVLWEYNRAQKYSPGMKVKQNRKTQSTTWAPQLSRNQPWVSLAIYVTAAIMRGMRRQLIAIPVKYPSNLCSSISLRRLFSFLQFLRRRSLLLWSLKARITLTVFSLLLAAWSIS